MRRIPASGAQVVIQALVGQCSVDFNRAFAAAELDEKVLRFGLIVDETIMCGIGAHSSIQPLHRLGLFRRKAVTVERSIPRALP